MSFIASIKDAAGNYLLAQEVKSMHRNKTFMNMDEAKSVGIVFDATNSEDFDLVKKYITYLREMKKRVKAIGFINQKGIPALAYSKLEYDFFSLKELSWSNIPKSIYVTNFIKEEFDILLDLNLHDLFPLRYISTRSKAKLKVGGKSKNDTAVFDLMIEADISKGLKYFLRNIDTYLFIINKGHDNNKTQ